MGLIGLFNQVFTYPILNALLLLYHLFGDFGLSIIVLTVIMRLALFPLTLKQLKSTKAMQAIQPQVAAIRKKHDKDKTSQYQAMNALYKESGVKPLAGFLPLLVQLPVLYGLFYALNSVLRSPALHNAAHTGINDIIYPFLPHFAALPNIDLNWFIFLNSAWHISLGVSDPTHILPILAGAATFVQLRMSQPKSTTGSKDMMTQQMQTMQFIMPFITVFFAWTFPAGLAVYWTTTSLFSIVQQYFVTGFGSLFAPINVMGLFGGNANTSSANNKSYNGDQRKESQLLRKAEEPNQQLVTNVGPVGRNLSTSSHTNGSSSRRRRSRSGSASARRRSNTSHKSRR